MAADRRPLICMLLHANYDLDPRVKREARHLASSYRVRVVHLCDPAQEPGVRMDGPVAVERFQLLTRGLPRSPFFWLFKYLELVVRMSWRAVRARANAYHAHDLPMVAPALLASRIRRAPVIYDAHELAGETGDLAPAIERAWKAFEVRVLPRVNAVIAVNQSRAEVMVEERGSPRPFVIPNYPMYRPLSALPSHDDSPLRSFVRERGAGSSRVLLYQGLISPGRTLDRVIRAMAHVRSDTVLVLIGHRNEYLEPLLELAREDGVSSRVLYYGAVDSDLLPEFTAGADAGLVIYADRPRNNYLCAPNKLFEYCMAGVPVVGCGFPEVRRVMQEHRIGESFSDSSPTSIARAIDALLGDAARLDEARAEALRVREKYHWQAAAPALDRLYAGIFSGARLVTPD